MGIPELVSHTTRPMRKGEVNGETYYFVTKEEFNKLEKLEQVCYAGNYYGLSKKEVDSKLEANDAVFAIVDKNGLVQLRKFYLEQVVAIYVYAPLEEMEKRMRQRGDSEEVIRKRIQNALETGELENSHIADYAILNIDLEKAKEKLREVVTKEISRRE